MSSASPTVLHAERDQLVPGSRYELDCAGILVDRGLGCPQLERDYTSHGDHAGGQFASSKTHGGDDGLKHTASLKNLSYRQQDIGRLFACGVGRACGGAAADRITCGLTDAQRQKGLVPNMQEQARFPTCEVEDAETLQYIPLQRLTTEIHHSVKANRKNVTWPEECPRMMV